MTIRITEDDDETGGYAFVDLGRRAPSPLLSFRRQDTEPRHLGVDGWQPEVAWLAPLSVAERDGRTVARFGPNVVDRIEELVPIEIVAQDGTSFGVVSWPFITPAPAGYGLLVADPVPPPSLTQAIRPAEAAAPPVSLPEEPAPPSDPEPVVPPNAALESLPAAAMPPESPRRRIWPALLALVLLLVAVGAGTYHYLGKKADIIVSRDGPATPWPAPAPPPEPRPPSTSPPMPETPHFSAAELRQRHVRLLDERAGAAAFVALGETAIASKQGGAAFRAFEEADPVANADAAWQLARFYDPRNEDAAYRDAAQPNVVRAAYYYALWRNRSARHTDELRGLCEANADLAGRDDRLRTICRP
ncbi:hypothetical protein [Methylobacterium nigriterrae]|uniref:hypothetical protein n=1 Tax=Methylobacterium nigriterrae TaxID=3127512 RepID=UPI003013A45B